MKRKAPRLCPAQRRAIRNNLTQWVIENVSGNVATVFAR